MQSHNWRTVLETIRLYGPLSRADVARSSGLSLPTISSITKNLVEQGLVLQVGQRQIKRGKPPVDYAINPSGAYSIGLNVDRDQFVAVLINLAGEVEQRRQIDLGLPGPGTDLPVPPQEMLGLMQEMVSDLLAASGVAPDRIWGIGLGLPGPLRGDGDGVVGVAYPDASAWNDVPVVAELHRRLELPVYLTGNAKAAAIGELLYGSREANANFLYLFVGISGCAAPLILNGRPYEGTQGNAGSLMFPPLCPVGASPSDVQMRHLQDFSLLHLYQFLAAEGVSVSTTTELESLYTAQNKPLLLWLETFAHHLAPLLLMLEEFLDLNAMIVGGRLPHLLAGHLLERLRVLLTAELSTDEVSHIQFSQGVTNPDAAAVGLAALSIYRVLTLSTELLPQGNNRVEIPLQ